MGDNSDADPELGHDAISQLLMVRSQPKVLIASPPKRSSALCPSSFASVINNTTPSMEGAVKVDPDFFEGRANNGSSPGPHFITMSIVKDKRKIKEQLLSALSQTVTILPKNLPNALIYGITKPYDIPPLPTATCSHFPSSGMQTHNYMYVPNCENRDSGDLAT